MTGIPVPGPGLYRHWHFHPGPGKISKITGILTGIEKTYLDFLNKKNEIFKRNYKTSF